MTPKLQPLVQAAIALSNYDLQQKEFAAKTKGLFDPRSKDIYVKLEKRLMEEVKKLND